MPTTQNNVVSIFDKKYTLSTTEEHDETYIQSVAKIVDDSMRSLSSNNEKIPLPQIAILAALNLIGELLVLRSDYESTESGIAVKTERLTASIERVFEQIEVSPTDS